MQTVKIITGAYGEFSYASNDTGKETQLFEAKEVWHRSFLIKNKEEYAKWSSEYLHGNLYIPGEDVYEIIKNQDENGGGVLFHFAILEDEKGEIKRLMLYGCIVYIMNDKGQTIDQFNS